MNILIGGTGFIGSALAIAMVARNQKVTSIAHGGRGVIRGVEYIELDLQSENIPAKLREQSDNVFVLIGQTGLGFNPKNELSMLKRVIGPFGKGKQRIFYFSSVLVYGNSPDPADEEFPCHPIGTYAKFKLTAEEILHELIPPERLVVFRLGNVYGGPKNRGLIGIIMQKVTDPNDDTPIVLHGGGKPRRDYVFIDDIAAAVLAVHDKQDKFGIVNIATGTSHSLTEVVETLSQVSGRNIPYRVVEDTLEEADTIMVSNRRLREEFGYDTFTPLEEGLRKTIARYKRGGNETH